MMMSRASGRECIKRDIVSGTVLERPAKAGDSPVCENGFVLFVVNLEYCPVRRLGRKQGGLVSQG